jgi:four helix bundle protein
VGVARFEDLTVWQKAKALSGFRLKETSATLARDYALWQQLNSASLSIVANIAEGFVRQSRKEFAQFVRIAAGSNGELRALLYVALERAHVEKADGDALIDLSNEIGRMLHALDAALRTGPPH